MKRALALVLPCALLAAIPTRADTSVVFNEVMYHPATNAAAMEWVELYNQMAVDVDISGWSLDGGIHYTFGPNTIAPGRGFVVVAISPATLAAATGLSGILGPFTDRMDTGSKTLLLRNNNGRVMDQLNYGAGGDWPVAPEGAGPSLAKLDHSTASGPARNWTGSAQMGGSPGQENFPTAPAALSLVFNELSPATNADFWVELANIGTNSVTLRGYVIVRDTGTNISEYVFPGIDQLAAGAFLALSNATLGFHPLSGDKLYLLPPARDKVLDAVVVKNGPHGRWPDGWGQWLHPTVLTPGTANNSSFHKEIVINEIMYHHQLQSTTNALPPQPPDEAWIELYNRSTNAVNLSGWKLDGGISYSFPADKSMAPGAYLVVAKDAAALQALYPAIDIIGGFSGKLSHNGDTIILEDAAGNPANVVAYFTGGHWPEYAGGGGSSLELRDPNADNSRPEAWAASDESGKSSWHTYTYQGVAETVIGPDFWNELNIALLSDGECLVDDISVTESPTNHPVQFIANGKFENGATGWRMLGTHIQSRVEPEPGNPANHVLHIISTGTAEHHMLNHIETTFTGGRKVTDGRLYRVSFRAKWLAGINLLNTKLYFDRVAQTTVLPTPVLNGTPGARNSCYATNIGPTFCQFQHQPAVPAPNQAVTVSVMAQDPKGVSSCEVWRSANGGAFSHTAMTANTNGLYTGTIPGFAAGTTVQFYVRAVDSAGVVSTYPAAGAKGGALYAVTDGEANPALGHNIRVVMTPANWALLRAATNLMSGALLPCTLIYDEQRPYYDIGVRLKGSMMGRVGDSRPSFHLTFQPDDLFRGVHPVMLIDSSGRPGVPNQQEEILVHHMALHAGNLPEMQVDLCWTIPPYEANAGPSVLEPRFEDEFIQTAYPDSGNGNVWAYELIYYPTTANAYGYKLPSPCQTWGVDISDLGDDKELYRYDYLLKNHHSSDDYSRLIPFAKTFSLPNGPLLDNQIRQVVDLDEWLRVFTLVSLLGESDWYSFGSPHNPQLYVRADNHRMEIFPWDVEQLFQRPVDEPLLGNPCNWTDIESLPGNRRRAYAHALDIIATTFNTDYMAHWTDHYAQFAPGQDYSDLLDWIPQRTAAVLSEINMAGGNSPFLVTNGDLITTSDNLAVLSGTAPVEVQNLRINGIEYPVTWTSVFEWTVSVPVSSPTSVLNIAGCDLYDRPLSNYAATVTVLYTGAAPNPGSVAINEIQYNPPLPGAGFVELLNTSTNAAVDLSNWRVNGIGYTFPPGSILGSGEYLVLAEDQSAFMNAYGAATSIFDEFPGKLQADGETLTLFMPGAQTNQPIVVNKVRYGADAPWPTPASGASLQIIDPAQDNWRVGNWAVAATDATPGGPNSVQASLPAFPPLWLNELQADNLTGITNNAGLRAPWIELYNPTTNTVSLNGLYLANNYSNLTQWAFPTNASINPGQFKIIFADSRTDLSTSNELHTTFTLPSRAGALALSRLYNDQPQVLDYIDYTNLIPNRSFGSFPDGQAFYRQQFFYATLGATNDPTIPSSFVAYTNAGAAYVQAFDLLPNPGVTSVNAANPVTINGVIYSLDNPFDFSLPAMVSGSVGGLGLTNMAGWYGRAALGSKFGATAGDQTTGGVLSFGLLGSGNRALGLLATSSTGPTAFGVQLINQTAVTLDTINLQVTGEVWRQSNLPKTLAFHYYIDLAATNSFPTNYTASLPALNVAFPMVPADVGGVAVDGTAPLNQTNLSVMNQTITNWPPGAALWLVWDMTDPTGKAQGLAIDNLSFSATQGHPLNTAPMLTTIGNQSVYANTPLSFNATATDADLPPQSLTFSLGAGAPAGAAITPNGLFTWTPTAAQAPSTNVITVIVTDSGTPPLSDSWSFTAVVFAPNTPPMLSPIPNQAIYANTVLTFTASATDADQPPQSLTFSLGPGAPAGADITTSGVFGWTPTVAQAPSTNLISVIVTDSGAPQMSATNSFSVVVYRPNTPPVLTALPNRTVYANTLLSFAASATDADQPPQSLTFSLGAGSPSGAGITPGGAFTWTPTAGQAPSTNQISVMVSDSGVPQMSATNSFSVVVYRPNTPPSLAAVSERTVYAGTLLSFAVSATDTDQPPQSLTFSLGAGAPTGASITSGGLFTWTPTAAQAPSTNLISVIVTDSGAPQMSATNSFSVVVYRPNTPPVLTALPNRTVYANTLLSFAVSATDTDQPPQSLTFSLSAGAPSGAAITTNGLFTWTPMAAQAPSTNLISVLVTDSGVPQMSATNGFSVVVYRPNTPPSLAPLADRVIYAGQTLSFTATATDLESASGTLTFSLGSGAPASAMINPTTGLFAWPAINAAAPSTNRITIIVSDGGTPALSDSRTITASVLPPPQLSCPAPRNGSQPLSFPTLPGQSYQLQYKDNLSDPAWTALTPPITGDGSVFEADDDLGHAQRFYRLLILLQ